jgi:tape measure domain-containing protein
MPAYRKDGDILATIEQSIALSDGVTPQFQKMAKAAEATTGKFEKAAVAANKIENAVPHAAAIQIENIGAAAYASAGGFNTASTSANNLKNNVNGISGAVNRIGDSMGNAFAKFTLASMVVMAITKIVELLTQAANKLTSLSDEYSGIVARIKLITSSQEQAVALNDQIYYSALRARGSYSGMADAVAKIGLTAKEAFPDPQVIVPFVENIQKLFTVGGTGLEQQKDAMLQLTQALGSGKLQGDEFRSIAEAAPMIEQIVAHFMGVTQGQLKQLSSDGKITADIMKNAILGATDEINTKFAAMPMTWGQVWQNMQTTAFRAFVPVFNQLSAIANSESMRSFGEMAGQTFIVVGQAVAGLINNVRWLSGIVISNGSIMEPVFVSLAFVLLAIAGNAGFAATMAAAHAAASAAETATIIGLTIAQDGLNAALYACPLTWIIFGVIAVIGIFYLAVYAVNHFAGTSISATGIIVGLFFWMGGQIYNTVAIVWNIFLAFVEFLGNAFKNPTAAIYNLFAVIWNGIVELVGRSVNEIIGLINKIPGMEVGFVNWGKGLASKIPISGGVDLSAYSMDYSSGNFMKGDDIGARGLGGLLPSAPSVPQAQSGFGGEGAGDIGKNTKDTADNTGKVKEAMEITDEDIKYLRDIAEQEVINKYTTAEVKIEMGGIHNNVSSDTDIDGMVRYMNDSLFDAMNAGADKVHP